MSYQSSLSTGRVFRQNPASSQNNADKLYCDIWGTMGLQDFKKSKICIWGYQNGSPNISYWYRYIDPIVIKKFRYLK